MAKLETIFCAMTWGLIVLLSATAFGAAAPVDFAQPAYIAELA